jgi:hypothetical protein
MTSATVDTHTYSHFAQLLFSTDRWAGADVEAVELGSVRRVPTTICQPLEQKEKAASECVIVRNYFHLAAHSISKKVLMVTCLEKKPGC